MFTDRIAQVIETRVRRPGRIAEAAAARTRAASVVGPDGRLVIVAADHPARGTLRAGRKRFAMADRADLLERLCVALGRPGVGGVLGTADVLEDLLLLGALEGKVVIGSMNRGGLAETVFELDDRFTGYDAAAIARMGFDGGKMLLRIDPDDPATADTMQACARAVSDLAGRGLIAMVEPFIVHRVDGRVRNDTSPEAMMLALTIASGLGTTSAYTWLKVPVVQGHGAGHGRLHPARAAARRRGSRRPRAGVRRVAEGAAAAERPGAAGRAVAAVPGRRRRGHRR